MGDTFASDLLEKGMWEFTLLDDGRPAVPKDFLDIKTICSIAITEAVRDNTTA
jgi:hypothetical protein